MVHVPYKSTGAAMPDFLTGVITTYVGNVSPLLPQIQAGKLKLLAVTARATMSLPPPGAKGTITFTGFAGHVCAFAQNAAKPTSNTARSRAITPPSG
jgi:hypothetical protein